MFSHGWDVFLRSTLVKLPRYVPTQVLNWTDPEGPYPLTISIPSRGSFKIPIYIFIKPDVSPEQAASLPVVIDFHGGGFILGSCLEQAPFCSQLARELSAVVISVDYRLGPCHKFPAALEDAEDVLRAVLEPSSKSGVGLRESIRKKVQENWQNLAKEGRKLERGNLKEERKLERESLKEEKKQKSSKAHKSSSKRLKAAKCSPRELTPQPPCSDSSRPTSKSQTPPVIDLDTTRIAISGFSSGGNIALNLAISLYKPHHEETWPSVFTETYKHPVPLLLFYPSFDSRQLPSERTLPKDLPPSSGYWAETSDILAPTYLPRCMAGHPRASPGLAAIEGLHEKARVILVLPGLDSLADQSETWVRKMKASGRAEHLRLERYPTMRHGWTQMPDSWLKPAEKDQKRDIYDKAIDFTRQTWNGD